MKKVYLVLSAFFVAGTVSAQLQKEERAPQKISKPERSDVVTLGSMDRAAGDPIYQDDFSNAALWDVTRCQLPWLSGMRE